MSKRIILAPSGSDGDTFPMLAFALSLRHRGHKVLVCAPPHARKLFESEGFLFFDAGLDVKAWTKNKTILQKNFTLYSEELAFLKEDLSEQFQALTEYSKEADVIFSGGYNYAAPSVAEHYGIKHFHVFHVPNVFPTSQHPPMMVPWQNLPSICNRLIWKMHMMFQNLAFQGLINEERKKLKLQGINDVWAHYTQDSILAVDPVLHEIPSDYFERHLQLGYWQLPLNEELPQGLLDFIHAGNKPFYFGFGSMPMSDKKEILHLIKKICATYNKRVIISQGWADLHDINDPNIFFVGKVSHQKLFNYVDIVVHHGGPGTVNSACHAGAVQIVIPHILDQFFWGEKLYRLGVSPKPIHRRHLSWSTFSSAFVEATQNSSLKLKARELREKLSEDGLKDIYSLKSLNHLGLEL